MTDKIILKSIGGFYYVKSGDEIIECKAKGKFRNLSLSPLAGDIVETEFDGSTNIISKIYPRKNKFVRPPFANLDLSRFKPENLNELFNDEAWQSMSESCLGCGTCTFICPTCQCYDIQEFNTGKEVKRFRCWDSCMYSDFTKMSAGQPRPTQKERFRQRFMHKLVYYPRNNEGIYSCVGCGRCLQKCPVNANIVKVIKTLREELS